MTTIAIVGSRNYKAPSRVQDFIAELAPDTLVVSGGAPGVDSIAAAECDRLGIMKLVIPAEWERHGRKAGVLRNKVIVQRADKVYAFWDGSSPGTRSTIAFAVEAGKPVTVFTEDARTLSGKEALGL